MTDPLESARLAWEQDSGFENSWDYIRALEKRLAEETARADQWEKAARELEPDAVTMRLRRGDVVSLPTSPERAEALTTSLKRLP